MSSRKMALTALISALDDASDRAEEALSLYSGPENGITISVLGMIRDYLVSSASTVQGLHASEESE